MKKKLLKGIFCIGILLSSTTIFGEVTSKIYLNGESIVFKNAFVEQGTTFIPLRAISKNLMITVNWDNVTQTVTINKDFNNIKTRVGSLNVTFNNGIRELTVAPKIKDGTVYVPLRFISEVLGGNVAYDKATNSINVEYEINK